jgi:hypothetical protein
MKWFLHDCCNMKQSWAVSHSFSFVGNYANFSPEDGDRMFHQHFDIHLWVCMASKPEQHCHHRYENLKFLLYVDEQEIVRMKLIICIWFWPSMVVEWLIFLLLIQETLGWNLGLENQLSWQVFLWFSLVPLWKCQDSTVKLGHIHFLPHPNSSLTHYPLIGHYIVLVNEKALLKKLQINK